MQQMDIFRVAPALGKIAIRDSVIAFFNCFLEIHTGIIKQSGRACGMGLQLKIIFSIL
jgi:hypothetical protein